MKTSSIEFQREVAHKNPPPRVRPPVQFTASALLNHVNRPSYFSATGRSVMGPNGLSLVFQQERHAVATRSKSCSGGSTNRYIIQACGARQADPIDPAWLRRVANAMPSSIAYTVAHFAGADCGMVSNGLVVCTSDKLNVQGGTTYGEVFSTDKTVDDVANSKALMKHEQKHSEQWASLGPVVFGVSYLFEMGKSQLLAKKYWCLNSFEVEAGIEEGGYEKC